MNFWEKYIEPAMNLITQRVIDMTPQILAGLLIVTVGWLVARILASLSSKLLQRVGFNGACERAGLTNLLRSSGYKKDSSWLVGRFVFWMLLLLFILSAAETIHMQALSTALQRVVNYIPNLIAVVLILVFGFLLARFMGSLTRGAASQAGLDFNELLGKITTYTIQFATVVIALSQLQIDSSVLNTAFGAVIGAFALGFGLMIALGGKDVARNIIAGVYARKSLRTGQRIQIDDVSGTILEIGSVNTRVEYATGIALVSNSNLIDGSTRILTQG